MSPAVALAELTTPGTPAPGWVPAPAICKVVEMDLRPGGALTTQISEDGAAFAPHLDACFLELVEERRRGNCVERVVVATARRYVISPEVLGGLGSSVDDVRDHFSSTSLVAVAARAIRELGELRARADEQGERLATMTLESQLLFASVEARNAFAKELSETVARLVVKYHDAKAPAGRMFRLVVGAYPSPGRHDSAGPVDAPV